MACAGEPEAVGESHLRLALGPVLAASEAPQLNLMPGQKPELPAHGKTYSGDYLMKVGVLLSDPEAKQLTSHVLELTAE